MKRIYGFIFISLIATLSFVINSCESPSADTITIEDTLHWTAVGDDGLMGNNVDGSYEFRVSNDSSLLKTNWDDCVSLGTCELLNYSESPLPAGSQEQFVFNFTYEIEKTYFFAVKSIDNANNRSLISNFAIRYFPDTIPPAPITDLH